MQSYRVEGRWRCWSWAVLLLSPCSFSVSAYSAPPLCFGRGREASTAAREDRYLARRSLWR